MRFLKFLGLSMAMAGSALLAPLSAAPAPKAAAASQQPLPPLSRDVRQLLVSIAPDWDSTMGRMVGMERTRDGWKVTYGPVPVLYGKHGLAWGRGRFGQGEQGREKVERDGRTPAGVFAIGKVYTYDKALPKGADFPYHTVTEADAWIDDPSLPLYNRHVAVDLKNPPPWFEKEKMRHGDFAYRWLVEIRHNADDPVPGKGSAIFFHIRRGVTRPSVGCTTMAEKDIVGMMRWLKESRKPHYAVLPWSEYQKKWASWGLPKPAEIGKIAP